MTNEKDNHTIRLLQEMRQEMREMKVEMREGFDSVNTRIDGITHIMTLMAGHSHDLEERVTKLEES